VLSVYCLFCVVLFIVCVQMCTVLLPPGDNPIAVNKYININTKFNTHLSQNVKSTSIKSFISLSNVKLLTDPIFTKLTLSRQLLVKISYTKLHENSTNIVEADITLQTGRLKGKIYTRGFLFLFCKERLESYKRSFNRIV